MLPTDTSRQRPPENQNQNLALNYRNRQIQVLQTALPPISALLESAFSSSSLCQHATHNANQSIQSRSPVHRSGEFLSLECAFDWLNMNYPEIASSVCQLISDDQEEPLPLDWAILVEDWDHTYWTVWIYLVWLIWLRNPNEFQTQHPALANWISRTNM